MNLFFSNLERKTLRAPRFSAISLPMSQHSAPIAIAQQLASRLGLDSLALAYQGQVHPETGWIRATEALLRPTRNGVPLPPDLVVENAERQGYGADLAWWTALQATNDAPILFPDRRGRVRLNLQENQISDPSLIDRFQNLWGPKGERNPGVDIEIVETSRVGPDRLHALEAGLRRLRASGAHLLLDDWIGSDEDYSRLTLIRRFSSLTIKLNKSWFSAECPPERLAYEIERLHRANVRLIAEGPNEPAITTLRRQRLPKGAQFLVQSFEYHRPQTVFLVAQRIAAERTQRIAEIHSKRTRRHIIPRTHSSADDIQR